MFLIGLIISLNVQLFPTFIPDTVIPDTTPVILLEKIANCESGDQQYNPDGTLVHNGDHIGLYQISTKLHKAQALSMGWDITQPAGNVAEALYLFHKNGTADWLASASCWGA